MAGVKTQKTQVWFQSAPDTMTKVKVTGITGLGGARDKIDVTDLESDERENLAGFASPSQVAMGINFDPALPEHQLLRGLKDSGELVHWVVGLADGTAPPTSALGVITYPTTRTYLDFDAYVADMPVDIATNDALRSPMVLERSGAINDNYKAP